MQLREMETMLGSTKVIVADPIFKGLASALMAGETAALLSGRMAVPVPCFMAKNATASRRRLTV